MLDVLMLTQITLPLRLIIAYAADIYFDWPSIHSYDLARTCVKYSPLRAFIV